MCDRSDSLWPASNSTSCALFDVTPISYAQFGLLPQVHRDEREIYDNIARLLEASHRPLPPLDNVPKRYLVS